MQAIEKIILGNSLAIKEMKKLIEMVCASATTVLIQGETGTGKELVAEALHVASGRKGSNISVNCAAIPSELLESELFGHEKGAFTGADRARAGRFEQANHGTIFLDEIGDMPLPLQSKLLRVLEGRKIQRVGSNKEIDVDFRLVCATHQDLDKKVEKGEFRADLFYRINVFPIEVPNLAMRTVDVPILIQGIIEKMKFSGQEINVNFSEDAIKVLSNYNWPGNVRELDNALQRALILQDGDTLHASDFNFKFCSAGKTFNLDNSISIKSQQKDDSGYKQELQNHEFNLIYDALVSSRGSKKHVAEKLGISPRTLRYKMAKMRDLGYTF